MSARKQYTCTKSVKAEPMTLKEFINAQGFDPTHGKDTPSDAQGYLVQYEDGYISWSPKEVFEKGYTITETFIDRMKMELTELSKKISAGDKFYYKVPTDAPYKLSDLGRQLDAMRIYADILKDRIYNAEKEENK